MLKLPIDTQFCTHFYTLESLLRNKCAVIDTINCTSFYEWKQGQLEQVKEKATHLQAFLYKQSWWKSVIDVYHVMMPVMYTIHNLDQKAPNLGKV